MQRYGRTLSGLVLGWSVALGCLAAADEPPLRGPALPSLPALPAVESRPAPQALPTPVDDGPTTGMLGAGAVEVIRERYPDRSVKIERYVTRDEQQNYVNHGTWSLWDPHGVVLATGEYWHGRRHGQWTRWFPAVAIDAPEDGGDADADSQATDPFADPLYDEFERPFISEATFLDGCLTGQWTITDAAGRPIAAWDLDRDRLSGKAVWWHPNGRKRREVDYVQGVLHGRWLEWDADGGPTREETYYDGRRHFRSTTRHPSGAKAAEGWFLSSKRETRTTLDWWNGVLYVAHEPLGGEGHNVRHGRWTAWHANGGKRFEGDFADGRPVGRHTWWYANGQVEVEGHHADGRRDGPWVFWHPNGQRQAEGTYIAGMPAGTWIRWREDGRVQERADYAIPGDVSVDASAVVPATTAGPMAAPQPDILPEPAWSPSPQTWGPAPRPWRPATPYPASPSYRRSLPWR